MSQDDSAAAHPFRLRAEPSRYVGSVLSRASIGQPFRAEVYSDVRTFGSAHRGACHMALCDGSVRSISVWIDAEAHRRRGNRKDGEPVTLDVTPAPKST